MNYQLPFSELIKFDVLQRTIIRLLTFQKDISSSIDLAFSWLGKQRKVESDLSLFGDILRKVVTSFGIR
jgi:hypothetical protein